jgi:hypothetical protein
MLKGCRGRDRMGVRLTTTCAVSAYHHLSLWIRITLMVRCTRYNIMWLSLSVIFSWYSTNKTIRHDITEILFKVPLNTITLVPYIFKWYIGYLQFKAFSSCSFVISRYLGLSGQNGINISWTPGGIIQRPTTNTFCG